MRKNTFYIIGLLLVFVQLSIGKTHSTNNPNRSIVVDTEYLEKWEQDHEGKKTIDVDRYKLENFTRLKGGQTHFEYYLLQRVDWGTNFESFLIYEYYESEMAVWLVNYDRNMKLIDAYEVFYDNAEGAWLTTSELDTHKRTIKITRHDIYADPEISTETIKIGTSGKK